MQTTDAVKQLLHALSAAQALTLMFRAVVPCDAAKVSLNSDQAMSPQGLMTPF